MDKLIRSWVVWPIALIALFGGKVGWGATLYVNGSESQWTGAQGTYGAGNNANAGTLAAPKATINNCITAASNGDTIYIANSVAFYNEHYDTNTGIYIAKNLYLFADTGPVTIISSAVNQVILTNKTSPAVTFGGTSQASSFIINAPSAAKGYYQAAAGSDTTNIDVQGVTGDGYYLDNAGSLTIMGGCTLDTAANGIRFRIGSVVITGGQSVMSGTGPFLNATGGVHAGFIMRGHTLTSSATYANHEIFYITRDGDITIGGDSESEGNIFNISSPDAFLMANWDTGTGETGSIKIKNNTINRTVAGSGATALGDTYVAGTANIPVEISYNSYTYPATQALSLVYVRGKVSPNISHNSFYYPGYNYMDFIWVEPYMAGDKGSPTLSYNTILTSSPSGHFLAVGAESTSAGDDTCNEGTISCNIFKGPMWDLVSDIPKTVVTWSDADFTQGQIVKYSNLIYECISNTTAHQNPINATYWTLLSGHSIFYGFSTNAKIRKNKLNGCSIGVVLKGDDQNNTSGYVRDNVFNVLAAEAFYSTGHDGTKWYNNVVYRPDIVARSVVFATIGSTGMILHNNAITSGVAGATGVYKIDNACTSGFETTYNIINSLSGNIGLVGSTTYADWASWAGSGYDTNSHNTDPLFVDPTVGDFSLQNESPCIRAGTKAGAVGLSGMISDGLEHSFYFAPYDRLNIGVDQTYSDADVRPESFRSLF